MLGEDGKETVLRNPAATEDRPLPLPARNPHRNLGARESRTHHWVGGWHQRPAGPGSGATAADREVVARSGAIRGATRPRRRCRRALVDLSDEAAARDSRLSKTRIGRVAPSPCACSTPTGAVHFRDQGELTGQRRPGRVRRRPAQSGFLLPIRIVSREYHQYRNRTESTTIKLAEGVSAVLVSRSISRRL